MKFIKLHNLADEEIWVVTDLITCIKWKKEQADTTTEYNAFWGFHHQLTPAHSILSLSGGGEHLLVKETPEEIFTLMDN